MKVPRRAHVSIESHDRNRGLSLLLGLNADRP